MRATLVRHTLRADALRDEFDQQLEAIRVDMLAQVYASTSTVICKQQETIILTIVLPALAAIFGLLLAILISGRITRSERRTGAERDCARDHYAAGLARTGRSGQA